MRYWWVNQNQTFKEETRGNFMWSPKQRADGGRNQFYENMREVSPGDVVFSYCDTRIKAIGVASAVRRITSEYCARSFPRSTRHSRRAEMDGQDYWDNLAVITAVNDESAIIDAEDAIIDQGIVGLTFREQVVRARRGQGVFRANVLLRETRCRVTGVDDRRHLKASHIKPWRDANDAERLDGSNGLLLSPHIDHLFDQGYITFSPNQELLIVPEVRPQLLDAWGIDVGVRVGGFSREQNAFLDYHRANVFQRSR